MSKSEKLREMQKKIIELEFQLKKANDKIIEYQKRDKLKIKDFMKVKK